MSDNLPDKRRKMPSVATVIANLQAGMTVPEIAKLYAVTESSVRTFCSRHSLSLVDLRNWKRTRADLLSIKQMQIVERMTPEKMEGASLRDQAGALASLNNIERLERGQSTANIDIQEVTERLEELTTAENALRAKMGKPLIPVDFSEAPGEAPGDPPVG